MFGVRANLCALTFSALVATSFTLSCFGGVVGETPWQLSFEYSDDGTLRLLNAQPLERFKKALVAPVSKGSLVTIPIEITWLDSNEGVLASAQTEIPLGVRVPIGEAPAAPGILRAKEVFALRILGPASGQQPATIRVRKLLPSHTPKKVSESAGPPSPPLFKSPQSFTLAGHQKQTRTILNTPGLGPVGVQKIQDNGSDGNRMVIVVVGDGYVESDILFGSYANHVRQTLQDFAAEPVWKLMMPAVNVYRIDVVSSQQGADYEDASPASGGSLRDTYFNTAFWTDEIERFLTADSAGTARAIEAADNLVGAGVWDQIIMIVNTSKYGGSGGSISINSMDADASAISVHELGHSFADLADEYFYDEATYEGVPLTQANVDTNPLAPKWSSWIDPWTPLPTPDPHSMTQ